jgi:hypothetical protein
MIKTKQVLEEKLGKWWVNRNEILLYLSSYRGRTFRRPGSLRDGFATVAMLEQFVVRAGGHRISGASATNDSAHMALAGDGVSLNGHVKPQSQVIGQRFGNELDSEGTSHR